MDFDEYRTRGKDMVDYIAGYLEDIRSRRVFPNVSPGYMRPLVPEEAPEEGEKWDDIFQDVERVIMPGITHWQSPYMHAYFPALNSCPSLLGDMLADAIGCLGFTWASSPACTELETIVMDWLGKMIGLPEQFLHSNEKTMGGGVIQTTASESTFVSVLAARGEMIKRCKKDAPQLDDSDINSRLVGYYSDQAHSSVEKAGLIGLVRMRILPSDDKLSLRGDTLREAIEMDRQLGYIPFYLCATLGTTGACAFDNLKELGPICAEEDLWLHIDAAYAGTAFICPEFRHWMEGVDYAHSIAFNPSKWMMVHFDCTAMWVRDSGALHRTFNVNPLYLRHENTGAAIDYMHWQIPLSKRFRALKLWFVIRSFGVQGLQKHVREGVRLAAMFEGFLQRDERFEIPAARHLGMVVFRLKGENELTEQLLKKLNSSGKVHMVPASLKGQYVIRFAVTSQKTTENDICRDWCIIRDMANKVLLDNGNPLAVEEEEKNADELQEKRPISSTGRSRRELMKKRSDFGMSLILSNVPMSPKIINGSYAALTEASDIITEYAQYLEQGSIDLNGRPIRLLSPRKRLKDTVKNQHVSFDAGFQSGPDTGCGRYPWLRQSSLDSKIDEIYDYVDQSDTEEARSTGNSPDLAHSNGTTNGTTPKVVVKDEEVTASIQSGEKKTRKKSENGLHPAVCKHCGHAI